MYVTRVLSASRNIFAGNLPWTVSKKTLANHFNQFGKVEHATVVFYKDSGWSKGYGFVRFKDENGYNKAIQFKEHELEGAQISVFPSSERVRNKRKTDAKVES